MPELVDLQRRAGAQSVMLTYFALCDRPRRTPLCDYRSLFTDDAVWEGLGERYASRFGRFVGGDAIAAALHNALDVACDYRFNLHQLTNELWAETGQDLQGSWLLMQYATLSSGESYRAVADIRVHFALQTEAWRIARFTSRNLMMTPMPDGLGDDPALADEGSLA